VHIIKTPLGRHLLNMAVQLLASVVMCVGITVFYTPNNFLSGGIWGVSMIFNYFVAGIPLGVFILILNIPLILWAWRVLERRFVFYTIWAIAIQSILLSFFPLIIPAYTENPLLACLFGGVLVGAGAGFVVKFYGSGGGLDIVGLIIKKRINISIGTISMFFNIIIVSIAALLFGFERAMYTMVSMYVFAVVFDKVLEGFSPKQSTMIITDRGSEIAAVVSAELGRGGTLLKAQGAYTHKEKEVLICIISRYEVPRIKEIVAAIDPHAFVSISESNEVMGQFNDVSIFNQLFRKKKAETKNKRLH